MLHGLFCRASDQSDQSDQSDMSGASGSTMMSQLDYINLFVSTMTAMWVGAGSMIMLGLYTRFGTTKGAWASLLTSCGMALCSIAVSTIWKTSIKPRAPGL